MAKFAVMDTNIGLVQWIGEASSPNAAVRKTWEEVGTIDKEAFPVIDGMVYTIPDDFDVDQVYDGTEDSIIAAIQQHDDTPELVKIKL